MNRFLFRASALPTLFLLFALPGVLPEHLHAQTPVYGQSVMYIHDSRGNRTARYLYTPKRGNDMQRSVELSMFPNPAKDHLTITYQSSSDDSAALAFTVLTSDGRAVEGFTLGPTATTHRLDLSAYPAGQYFLLPDRANLVSLDHAAFVVIK